MQCPGENNRRQELLRNKPRKPLPQPLNNYSIWDSILWEKVYLEENITLLLNCSCNDVAMEGSTIKAVRMAAHHPDWHTVEAKLFADCSGDSILAP